VVNTDITDKKRLEAELLRAAQLSLIGEMAAGLAHEIKNPLAGVGGAVDILILRRPADDPEREVLEGVRREVDRIDVTVRELLGRARPRIRKVAPAALAEVAQHAVRLARDQAASSSVAGKRISVEFEAPTEPIVLPIDAGQIEDAILNLVLNAIAAVGADGRIVVRVRRHRAGPDAPTYATVEVEDNGPGIAEHERTRIFAPFYTTSPHGTGLGLAAVRRIAHGHGGRIDVRSTVGAGSVFTLSLPVAKADER